MKAVISQKELDRAIQIVNRAAATKSLIPALAGILINAESGKLVLTANNYEIAIQHTVDADVDEPGKVLVSGRLLAAQQETEPWASMIGINRLKRLLHRVMYMLVLRQ